MSITRDTPFSITTDRFLDRWVARINGGALDHQGQAWECTGYGQTADEARDNLESLLIQQGPIKVFHQDGSITCYRFDRKIDQWREYDPQPCPV